MASGAFFDPLVLLRVAPVVSSTMAMRFSHDQWLFLDNFLAPEHRERANGIVPSYFRTFFMRGIWDIGILYTLTAGTGIANAYSRRPGAWRWYAAGTALAFSHMAFAPFIMYKVKALSDDEPKGQGNRLLREWLNVHALRSWMADIPAWACFVVGCLKSLQPS
ncbi:putative integral membrane [Rosellinia necatrix]|uniref:Putative integral membrane n=1 Tax=Rosellinia necatrix TaxID=77044 RepID=A0A1W2TIR1_ROSNE|nr:putative integral membrane [Rosellinia necatrix]